MAAKGRDATWSRAQVRPLPHRVPDRKAGGDDVHADVMIGGEQRIVALERGIQQCFEIARDPFDGGGSAASSSSARPRSTPNAPPPIAKRKDRGMLAHGADHDVCLQILRMPS